MSGPKIVECQVRYSRNPMKSDKSPDHDVVYAEIIKHVNIKELKYLSLITTLDKFHWIGSIPLLSPYHKKELSKFEIKKQSVTTSRRLSEKHG